MAEQKEQVRFTSENNFEVVGRLDKLEISSTKRDGSILQSKAGIPMKMVRADITIAEGETHRLDMIAMERYRKEDDDTTAQWKAVNTMEEQYVSKEESENTESEHYGKPVSVVRAVGNYDINVYKNQGGETIETVRKQARFISRADNVTPEKYEATFEISGMIKAKTDEMQGDSETGRKIVTLLVVDYSNKAFPMSIVVGEEGADWVEDDLELGQTITFQGDDINKYLVKEVERENEGDYGKVVDTIRERKSEFLASGGTSPLDQDDYDGEDDEEAIKVVRNKRVHKLVFNSQMTEAIENYEKFKAEREAASSNKPKKEKKTGFPASSGGKTKSGSGGKKTIQASDLPF